MRVVELEEFLKLLEVKDLEVMAGAAEMLCKLLPEQLVQEMSLRFLTAMIKLVICERGDV